MSRGRIWPVPARGTTLILGWCLLALWVFPALIASFRENSPLVHGLRRLPSLGTIKPDQTPEGELRQALAEVERRFPRHAEVAIWLEPGPIESAEVALSGFVWITASYLLYPRRVVPISTPEFIGELETRRLIVPSLITLVRARMTALKRGEPSPLAGILVWGRTPPCRLSGLDHGPYQPHAVPLRRGCLLTVGPRPE